MATQPKSNVIHARFSDRPLDGEPRSIPIFKEALELTGNLEAGYLFSYIATWYDTPGPRDGLKTMTTREGKEWISKPILEWAGETQMSYSQVRRALSRLRALGLIETKVFIDPKRNWTVCLHTRIDRPVEIV